MALSRDAILQANDLPRETVPVPEWGGDVIVRGLTGTERDAYEAETFRLNGTAVTTDLTNMRARLVARTLIDEQGNRLFNDGEVMLLGRKSAVALQRVFEAAQRLSGLTASDVEELRGN